MTNRTELVQKKFGALTTGLTTKYEYPSGEDAKGPHRLSSAVTTKTGTSTETASTVFEYDAAGNQTNRTGTGRPSQILTWDAEGELRQVNTTGAGATGEGTMTDGEASFVYDASGERLVRTTDAGTTVYLPGGQEFTVQSSGEVAATRYYSFAGSTVAVRTGRGLGGVDSIVCDRNGTPLVSVKNTQRAGQVVKQYTDPFGGIRGGGVSTVNGDRQFVGQPRDDATGLSMLGARYYDEGTGQFVSVDPQLDPSNPAQFNAYVYSGNNPLTWSDPSGLNWFSDKVSGAAKAAAGWVNKYQAEIVGAVAGGVTFAGCMAGTWGVGSVGCAAAAGAVGGAVTNLWKSKVQHTQAFSWSSLATDTVVGGVLGAAGGVIGKAVAPIAKSLAASVSNSVRTATAKAGGAVASAARQAGDAVKAVAKRATSNARSAGSKAASSADDALEGGACGLMSFAADTRVLLADGTTKPIAEIEVGDEVLAADPVDGTQAGKPVEAVHVHDDALVDLIVDGAVIRTTEDHPFWSVTDQQFERADHLTPGEEVLTATGTTAIIDGLDVANNRYAPAHNLTISDLHTYYVVAGTTSALVHNCGTGSVTRPPSLTPDGAGRAGAFRQAKRDSGVPTSASPTKVGPNVDRRGKVNRPGFRGGSQSPEDESHGCTEEVPGRAA